MRKTIALALAAGILTMPAPAEARDHVPGCNTNACDERVTKRAVHAGWRAAVRAYGVGLLRARMRCESGSHGGYALTTTGNGYWFAHQFDVRAWVGAGGRYLGRPVGRWSTHPSRLEQDFRAVVWDRRHGGDPWPLCP